ncbi:MAG TPA: ATP-binding cassette domain-containing protein [Candidatus Cloacimonas acidaminovorans]|nr:ATP-binding cassette domain-containing protein [Candidatus Cloacimonas acidaminovorans]HRS61537.1 ATP-binding cassette domain-containing protein [Candidatus Cloacimonas sp.]
MHIAFKNVSINGLLHNFNLNFTTDGCTVLYDPCEKYSSTILTALMGLYNLDEGNILLDGIYLEEYCRQNSLISTFSLVFDEGIMLSNLSLCENLLLPWNKRFASEDQNAFEQELKLLMEELNLNCGWELRPAYLSPAERKFFCFIRSLLLKPKIMLIDDPYYLFNKEERRLLLGFLQKHSKKRSGTEFSDYPKSENTEEIYLQEMLIGTSDDDFTGEIATQVIDLSEICY